MGRSLKASVSASSYVGEYVGGGGEGEMMAAGTPHEYSMHTHVHCTHILYTQNKCPHVQSLAGAHVPLHA